MNGKRADVETMKDLKAQPGLLAKLVRIEEGFDVAIEVLPSMSGFKVYRAQQWLFTAPSSDAVETWLAYQASAMGIRLTCKNTITSAVCEDCAEQHYSVSLRDNGHTCCDRCWRAHIAHGAEASE